MWFDVTYCWPVVVRCGMYNTLPHLAHHHIWRYSKPHHIPRHTIGSQSPYRTFHIAPTPLAAHYSTLQYHIGFKSHHIGHIMHHTISSRTAPHFHIPDVPHNATFHVLYISDHTIYWPHHLCIAPPPHFTRYCTAFHMLHILHHSTTSDRDHTHRQFHIPLPCFAFHIAHQYTTTFYIPPLATSRITPPPLPGIAPCHSPLHLVPHCTTFHIPCHSTHTHTNPHYTTTFHNPILVWETRNYMWSVLLCSFIHIQPFIPHVKPNTKMVVKKCNFIHKVPEKVIPVCPNTNLFWVVVFFF